MNINYERFSTSDDRFKYTLNDITIQNNNTKVLAKSFKHEYVKIGEVNKKINNELMDEMKFIYNLKHPNILKFIKYDYHLDKIYFEVPNGNLYYYIKKKILKEEHIIKLMKTMGGLIKFFNQKNIIHNGINPYNIFLFQNGNDFDFKWGDFTNSLDYYCMGYYEMKFNKNIINYMAPENFFNELGVNFRSDLFSLGVVLFELSSSKKLFNFKNLVEYKTDIDLFYNRDCTVKEEYYNWVRSSKIGKIILNLLSLYYFNRSILDILNYRDN